MTNFEKVKEEMKIEYFDGYNGIPCEIIKKLRKEYCSNITCEECREWLAQEYVEPIELSEIERTILQNIDKKYKYIARDLNDGLFVYEKLPIKETEMWKNIYYTKYASLKSFNHLFRFIQWKDEEPYSIAELLEG